MSEEKDIYDLTPFNMDYEDEDHIQVFGGGIMCTFRFHQKMNQR